MTASLTAGPGTISIAANSTAVVGTGTAFSNYRQGSILSIDGAVIGQFASDPADDTHATLVLPIGGTAITGATYALGTVSALAYQSESVRQFIETFKITKPGIPLTMDATLTLGDPGAGKVRFNSATNPTVACISYTDNLGNSCKARVQALDDSVNAVARAVLEFLPASDGSAYLDLDVTGAITDETTYAQVPVALRSGAVPADKAALAMVGVSAGADGANGILSTIATQAQAQAGTDNTTGMTPLRTAEAITAQALASSAMPGNDYHQALTADIFNGTRGVGSNRPPGNGAYGPLMSLLGSSTDITHLALYAQSGAAPEIYAEGTQDGGTTWSAWAVVTNAILQALGGLTGANGDFIRFTGAASAVMQAIVGTVAQSSGVPTGAIVETGSNSNGTYTRFADGTQICEIVGAALTLSNSSNLLYAWTFPAVFAGIPSVFSQLDLSNFNSVFLGVSNEYARSIATTNCLIGVASKGGFVSGNETLDTIHGFAIGRWF